MRSDWSISYGLQALCTTRSHDRKLHILVSKLHSGTSKTMHLPLFWKSHCATCRVLPTSQVVYQPINHRNLWSIAFIYQALYRIRSPGTKLHILVSKLHSGTSKTMHLPLFWKSHCATCSPVYAILYHLTGSCKGPIIQKTRDFSVGLLAQ